MILGLAILLAYCLLLTYGPEGTGIPKLDEICQARGQKLSSREFEIIRRGGCD